MAERKEIEFCEAIRIFAPNEKAQSFILATIKIDIAEGRSWGRVSASGCESQRPDEEFRLPAVG